MDLPSIGVLRGANVVRLFNDGWVKSMSKDLDTDHPAGEHDALISEQMLRIADHSMAVIFLKDIEGRYRLVNRRFETLLGMNREEILGKSDHEVFPRQVADVLHLNDLRVLEAGTALELEESLPYGKEMLNFISIRFPLYDSNGNAYAVCGISTDTTERQRAIKLLESAIQQSNELIVITTADLEPPGPRIVFMNPALTKLMGYSAEEVIGQSPRMLQGPKTDRLVLDRIRQCLVEGNAFTGEVINYGKDGTEHQLELHITPLCNELGELTHFVSVQRDITSRKQLEEALRHQAQELAQANRVKDEFLATVSHELRTPLNAMLGWTQLLRRGKLDDATHARAVETIERNTRLQARLIEQLLDVTRIISGKLHLDMVPVELETVIAAALNTVRPTLTAKAITLTVNLEPAVGAVLGDADRLQQVFWNLFFNAAKFTPQGGHIEVRLNRVAPEDTSVQIVIQDTGQGISAEFLPYVFERFRQADGTTTRAHGGMGMGLAIVGLLVEMHGGTITVCSPGVGQGSTFTVTLPLITGQGIPTG